MVGSARDRRMAVDRVSGSPTSACVGRSARLAAVPSKNAKIHARLLEYALSFPEAWQDEPWEGDVVAKVGKKIFVFFGHPDSDFGIGVKLPESNEEALAYPFTEPSGYGLGRWGWVNARFARGHNPPVDMLEEWIEESYRAVAPKKLVRQLDQPA
jgi:predicted DNA-binding protein (MmcQ/YjbR family)